MSVLLVDQEEASQNHLAGWLKENGYHVLMGSTGPDALSLFSAHRVGIVLFSIDDQHPADLGAFARMRELPDGKAIPFVVLYDAQEDDISQIHALVAPLNVTEFIRKSVDFATMASRMETLLPNKGYLLSEAKPALSGVVTVRELREVHSRIGQQNYYDRLGIPVDQRDNGRAIRVAYHTLARRYDQENMTEHTNEVRRLLRDVYNALGKAYEVLTDTDTRNQYNFKLAADAEADARAETEVRIQAEALAALEEKQAAETAAAKAKEEASAPAWNLPQGDAPAVVNEEAPAPPTQNETPVPPTQNETPAPPSQKNDPVPDGMQEFWDKRGVGEHEPHEKLSTAAHLQAIMGDYEGAVELYEQCVKLQPENDEYLFKLELARGRMFKKSGNKLRAQKHFETAQAIAPVGNNSAQEELDELVQIGKKTGGGLKNLLFSKKKT